MTRKQVAQKSAVVLDTSAVIAYMLGETGGARVQAALQGALLSSVNLCEVVSNFAERGEDAQTVLGDVLGMALEVVPFSSAHARMAAALHPPTPYLGLGDRACLALGLERGSAVLTADQPWTELDQIHQIAVIR
ncbi:type II toxin-antitoxin system VapC family toxin [Deinococcus sp.]|uniref:type II toxin-antitoxin system VapC family toxin n=1 Tax=Deinococcus sp. TaxID=47478 RepID=UPI003CC65344